MNADNHTSGGNDADRHTDVDLDNVEISDIPFIEDGAANQSAISRKMIKLGRHLPIQRRGWRWLMGIATCSLLLGLLLSNLSALKTSVLNLFPALAPVPVSSNNTITLNTAPGTERIVGVYPAARSAGQGTSDSGMAAPAPRDCPAVPEVTASREIGSSPVWLYGFDGPRAAISLRGLSQPVVHNIYGWPVLIQLMVKDNFTLPVTLSGGLRNGPTIFFAFYPGAMPVNSVILETRQQIINPIQPEAGQKAVWISTMFLFGSGCYTLKASWPGGEWSINFAAGR